MPFQKGNKLGAKRTLKHSLDQTPLSFATWKGDRDRIKKIPDWQNKLRDYVRQLIEEHDGK